MRLSRYFLPILREAPARGRDRLAPADAARRHDPPASGRHLFLAAARAAGAATRSSAIVREEQNRAGAVEILMPTIQSADLWRESGRYDAYGKEMLRIKDRHERDMLFGPTNEEMVTDIFRAYVKSYRDLPLNLYHIQWKFRDEVRPRFGVMRSREFLMKDAYSFDLDQAGARHSYNRMFVAYLRTFARLGLKAIPMRADTGPIGGDLSHEFIILAADRRERGLLPQRLPRLRDAAGRHRFRRRRRPAGDRRPLDVALRRDLRDARRRRPSRRVPERQAAVGARHRGRPHLLLRHQVFRADGRHASRVRTAASTTSIWAPTASARAGSWPPSSRRATTRPASSGRTRSRRSTWRS